MLFELTQSLLDFPHYCICDDFLCFTVIENLRAVCKGDTDGCGHIKTQCVDNIVVSGDIRRSLNLRNQLCNFLFSDLCCDLFHFCSVFRGSATVSVLCATTKIPDTLIGRWMITTQMTHCFSSLPVAGMVLGFLKRAVQKPLTPDFSVPRIIYSNGNFFS